MRIDKNTYLLIELEFLLMGIFNGGTDGEFDEGSGDGGMSENLGQGGAGECGFITAGCVRVPGWMCLRLWLDVFAFVKEFFPVEMSCGGGDQTRAVSDLYTSAATND